MNLELNLQSSRVRQARFGAKIGKNGYLLLLAGAAAGAILGFYSFQTHNQKHLANFCWAGSCLALCLALWYRGNLTKLPSKSKSQLTDLLEPALLASLKEPLNPQHLWSLVQSQWQTAFLCSHLPVDPTAVGNLLEADTKAMDRVWQKVIELAPDKNQQIHAGHIAAAILTTSHAVHEYLAQHKLSLEEVIEVLNWLDRLIAYSKEPKTYFGGLGRDWAAGFTPLLDKFGQNFSHQVESGQGHFHFLSHAEAIKPIVQALSQTPGAVAIIGEAGVGKTSMVYALAQRLLSGQDISLRYWQVVSLNASEILSEAGNDLEKLLTALFYEAIRAGNIIIFLDEAEVFFSSGVGAFDLSKVLSPILDNSSLKIITTFTPHDFQKLKAAHGTLASKFIAINLSEPNKEATIKILEDTALTLQYKAKVLINYQAIREALRLSEQFEQDLAYPGKAIRLLEEASAYADSARVIGESSVWQAVENSKGVKIGQVQEPEANQLLNLEDQIHQRMINQERAVKVVAAALRRSRAGVANPKRPIGSFLFLGPTGVGKTELARSLAATYFSDEKQMIRLDMSEYQRPQDVSRILSSGQDEDNSLILAIRQQPFAVVLLDEVEKAHPHILNLLLQLLDEGELTDEDGRQASFREAIIIATSNAGAVDIADRIGKGQSLDDFERPLIDKLIAQGQFKPELINRFDEVVLFRPLKQEELTKVAKLMLETVNQTLANQNIHVSLTEAALNKIVKDGHDLKFGARPMRRLIQQTVEDAVAKRILSGQAQAGSNLELDIKDLSLEPKPQDSL